MTSWAASNARGCLKAIALKWETDWIRREGAESAGRDGLWGGSRIDSSIPPAGEPWGNKLVCHPYAHISSEYKYWGSREPGVSRRNPSSALKEVRISLRVNTLAKITTNRARHHRLPRLVFLHETCSRPGLLYRRWLSQISDIWEPQVKSSSPAFNQWCCVCVEALTRVPRTNPGMACFRAWVDDINDDIQTVLMWLFAGLVRKPLAFEICMKHNGFDLNIFCMLWPVLLGYLLAAIKKMTPATKKQQKLCPV